MNWQNLIVLLIVGSALIYIASMLWKKSKAFTPKDKGCGADCGCDSGGKKTPL